MQLKHAPVDYFAILMRLPRPDETLARFEFLSKVRFCKGNNSIYICHGTFSQGDKFLDCPRAMWSSAHPNSVRSSYEHCQRHSFCTPTFALQAIGRQRKNVPPLERVMRTPVNAFLREFPQYGLSRRY